MSMTESLDVTFACEGFDTVIREMKRLFPAHWKENAVYEDIPLDPDYDLYKKMNEAGMCVAYTGRFGYTGSLIAYAVFMLRPSHLHYKSHGWAINDIIWVHPAHRNLGIGSGLVETWETDLRKRGIHVVHVNSKVAQPALGALLKIKGYAHIENGHSKRLI